MILQNRKKYVTTGRMVPVPLAILVVLLPVLSFGYLWMGARCEAIGREMKAMETDIAELRRKCLFEESRWMKMKSPGEIEKALRRHHLEMTWPSERQIVRMGSSEVLAALGHGPGDGSRARYAHVGRQARRISVND